MSAAEDDFLDGWIARGLALLVAAGCVGVLAYIHRDDLFPREERAMAESGVFVRCYAERRGQIDEMVKSGVVKDAQAALFRARAEALCRDLERKAGAAAPPVRGLR